MLLMNVPKTLNDTIVLCMENLVDDNAIPDNFGSCIDAQVEEIEHNSYDGFIPHTNGGYRLTLLSDLSLAWGSGSYPSNVEATKFLEKVIDNSLKDSLYRYIQETKDKLQEVYPDRDFEVDYDTSYNKLYELCNYHDLYEDDQAGLAEDLSNYETEYMTDGSTFAYQFTVLYFAKDNFRNESGKDELYFYCGINTDFEHIRDSGLICTYSHTVPLQGLTKATIEGIFEKMVESI